MTTHARQSRSRGTSKPCPGCGRENTHRPVDGVCSECEALLREALAARERAAAQTERQRYRVPGADHAFPAYRVSGTTLGTEGAIADQARRRITLALAQLTLAAGPLHTEHRSNQEPVVFTREGAVRDWMGYGEARVLDLAVPLAAALDALDQAIAQAMQASYMQGFATGRNLLLALSEGQVTADEFERRSLQGRR